VTEYARKAYQQEVISVIPLRGLLHSASREAIAMVQVHARVQPHELLRWNSSPAKFRSRAGHAIIQFNCTNVGADINAEEIRHQSYLEAVNGLLVGNGGVML
jgi:hypothetical protein